MAPLPAHFDLEQTFAEIDSPIEPKVAQKPVRLQRIENLPMHQPSYQPNGIGTAIIVSNPLSLRKHWIGIAG